MIFLPTKTYFCVAAELMAILNEYYARSKILEGEKYDLEYATSKKDYIKNDLALKVNHVRGKL